MPNNMFDLTGKTAVVIGGTSGIGRAIAIGLAEAGADVVPTARRAEEVKQTAAQIEALGRKTLARTSDILDRKSLETLHDAVLESFGRIDILVNSAGITQRVPTLECPEEEWNRVLDTNLTGTLRACQIFGKTMVQQNYGRIVNIASLSTFVAFYEVAAYGVSKAGIGALTQSLSLELCRNNICVNAIAPGIFRTALNSTLLDESERGVELLARTPMKRFGDVRELVGTAVFLSSDAASYVNGQIIPVDGGFLASGVNQ
jgi:NAD(P)-dependent dehydrogenase (short-subunit alcohol dehydrogenase family)